jgi:hypothetical protein
MWNTQHLTTPRSATGIALFSYFRGKQLIKKSGYQAPLFVSLRMTTGKNLETVFMKFAIPEYMYNLQPYSSIG